MRGFHTSGFAKIRTLAHKMRTRFAPIRAVNVCSTLVAGRGPGRRGTGPRGHDYLFELTLDSPARLVGPEVQGWSHLLHTRRGCSGADRGPAGFPGNTRLSGRLTVLKPLKPLGSHVPPRVASPCASNRIKPSWEEGLALGALGALISMTRPYKTRTMARVSSVGLVSWGL